MSNPQYAHADEPYTGASLQAIQDHYDLSNAFYALWLDSRMLYSSALYHSDDESLEQAQINKLDHHLQSAQASQAESLLEIGCGWGALLERATQSYGVKRAVGLTLSDAQASHVRALSLPGVEARVENWQDHHPTKPSDSIVSVGTFEHFPQPEYSDAEMTNAYRKFFKRCQDEFIKPDGFMSIQTFAYGSVRNREQMVNTEATQFLAREIFKETDPPHLSNIVEAAQGMFEIVALRNDRLHYARTLREWINRLKARREEAEELVGTEQVETYLKYLQYSFIGFQTGNLDLYRIRLRALPKPWKRV